MLCKNRCSFVEYKSENYGKEYKMKQFSEKEIINVSKFKCVLPDYIMTASKTLKKRFVFLKRKKNDFQM